MMDRHTRFAVVEPLTNETSRACAEAFVRRWVATFGPPVKLLSDRGEAFVDGVMRLACALLGLMQISTSAYSPTTNGMMERFNRTLLEH